MASFGRSYFPAVGIAWLLALSAVCGFSQNTTLVYEPDIQLGAGGPVVFLEERVNGELARSAKLLSPGIYQEFVQRRHADGRLRRLVWRYGGQVSTNYTIEEQDSQPDGTWTRAATLEYQNGLLVHARFYSGVNLIEERIYEYDRAGRVTMETTSKALDEYFVQLEFERPEYRTVEAFQTYDRGVRMLVARLQYDTEGRLTVEERFVNNTMRQRDVYAYDRNDKIIYHIRYDNRELPVRHVTYGYTKDGLPVSVVHRDVKDRVLFALHYSREYDGENSMTTIRDSNGEISGTIDYRRENGRDVRRTEVFLLGSSRLEIVYTSFDERGNWLRKELTTYNGATVKERTVTSRIIRYAR